VFHKECRAAARPGRTPKSPRYRTGIRTIPARHHRGANPLASAAATTTEGVSQSQVATADVARMSTGLQQLAAQFRG
jgi:hypothetical protein